MFGVFLKASELVGLNFCENNKGLERSGNDERFGALIVYYCLPQYNKMSTEGMYVCLAGQRHMLLSATNNRLIAGKIR